VVNEDKIKDLFGSKLSNFEPEVPASVWAGIDQFLSQQPPVPTPDSLASQAAGTTGSALKTTLIALGAAASLAVGVFLYNSGEEPSLPVVEDATTLITAPEAKEEPLLQEVPDEQTAPLLAFVQPRRTTVAPEQPAVEEQETEATPEAATKPETEKNDEIAELQEVENVEEIEETEALSIPQIFKEDIALSLRTSVGGLSSSVNERGGSLLFSGNNRSSAFNELLKEEDGEYKLAHRQPVSVGFTASKALNRNLSFETGLMFTYLYSKVTSNSAVNIEEKQTFGYLGIPVYINYEFYRLKRAKFYLSLGAMMQKDIFGKCTSSFVFGENLLGIDMNSSDYDIIYSEPQYLKKNISQSNWQFSSHLNIGMSYPVYRRLYFYTQLGGVYYFDAGNEYRTIFSDRKFQLDLNLGLRLEF